MTVHFNSIISKIKNAYRRRSTELYVKNFSKSEVILKQLTSNGYIRGFTFVSKKVVRVYLSYDEFSFPSLTASTSLTSIRKKTPVGSFNVDKVTKDFNTPYVSNFREGLHHLRNNKRGRNFVSQGIFLLR